MSSTFISTEKFDAELKSTFVEVSSAALGARVLSCSDDFFASKDNLIKPSPSASLKGQFGPNGALYDGWESRRHNHSYDWVIIRLAPLLSTLHYVDIDTSHFKGNEAPYASVHALRLASGAAHENVSPNDPRWHEILPVVELGPDSRHIFSLGQKAQEGEWSMVMVRMIPDGGMARFRAYGRPVPPSPLPAVPSADTAPINLLSPLLGAHIVSCSDANFSPPGNLLLPGRGVDMSDGWETRRSQEGRGKYAKGGPQAGEERREWVVAKLAGTGAIQYIEVDTAFHPGNYPVACMIEATLCSELSPPQGQKWTTVVAKKPLGPHRQHWLDVERTVAPGTVYSHVRFSIFPDGGVKRLRVLGHPLSPSTAPSNSSGPTTIPALPLTAEAFAPYGDVIQGYSLPSSAPKGVEVTIANQGTAFKFNREGPIAETYPEGMLKGDGLAIGCVRGMPFFETRNGALLDVKMLERHACTSQAFIPMGKGVPEGTKALPSGGGFVVVAALNGKDDKPDLSTLRAFLATAAQGVNIRQGIWHHHLWTVDAPMDYACVEAQIGEPGLVIDCEIVKPVDVFCKVSVAPYTSVDRATIKANGHLPHGPPHAEHHGALETLSHLLPSLPPAIEHSLHADSLIHPTPITPEAFAPFGNLILAYPDEATRPGAMIVTGSLKTGKAEKYTRLAHILSTYPPEAKAQTSIGVYRATKKVGLERGKVFDIRYMERHPYTTQAFIPMGKAGWDGYGEEALPKGGAFLVVVAKNGPDDRPDPATVKSFIMESATGLSYAAGTWHHPVLVLDSTLDLACVETQIYTGARETDPRDCELLKWEGEEVFGRIAVPALESDA